MRPLRIYIATSWKMDEIALVLADLLRGIGYDVDCFCDESTGRYSFTRRELGKDADYLDAVEFLRTPQAQRAFAEDKKWLDWSDVVILILPSGRSAHLEAGYGKGSGKRLYILGGYEQGKYDVMYGFADGMYQLADMSGLFSALRDEQEKINNG